MFDKLTKDDWKGLAKQYTDTSEESAHFALNVLSGSDKEIQRISRYNMGGKTVDDVFMKYLGKKGYEPNDLRECVRFYDEEMYEWVSRNCDRAFLTFSGTEVLFHYCLSVKNRKHQLEFEF